MSKKKQNNMMTDYEETCMWMSYRYAIGRSSIASHYHALDIAKNCYKRMTDERSEFTAHDIRREIASHLRMSPFMFYEEKEYDYKSRPLEHFFEWLNGKSKYELAQVTKICHNSGNYEVQYTEVPKTTDYLFQTFNDLIIWANLASLFDISNHKICTLVDGTECEYFEGYFDRTDYNEDPTKLIYNYEKVKIPVSEFSKGRDSIYIPDESIKSE